MWAGILHTAYYKPKWANEAWDRHFTGFGRLWITRFPFRIHLTYDDPLPEDPAKRRKQELSEREAAVEQLEENSKSGLAEQRRAAAKAARARAIAEVRARARGEYTEGGAESPGAHAGGSKKSQREKRRGAGASASAIDKANGRRLLHLCTDSSQEAGMHAIDLRRLVRQNRAPEIQRRARIRDRLLALKDRRVRLPKILHVPVRAARHMCHPHACPS